MTSYVLMWLYIQVGIQVGNLSGGQLCTLNMLRRFVRPWIIGFLAVSLLVSITLLLALTVVDDAARLCPGGVGEIESTGRQVAGRSTSALRQLKAENKLQVRMWQCFPTVFNCYTKSHPDVGSVPASPNHAFFHRNAHFGCEPN